ncbi:lipid II:glycine glycyltransferase FemX [Aestuariivirga litoralis]|uniref:lipid II:glycine glycyltransferase FemX n=1 Tax=Aestuariivirga litoralis TaxID=2650924 RepID=UPI0018C4AAEE|nr:GNAT family N-acetyltransferase [Aestuariivirga litoralis]MBG1232748.1 GNAT family N-acetyltransferase [Aestuariivirga litoralis]
MLMKTRQTDTPSITLEARLVPRGQFDDMVQGFDGVVQEVTIAFAESRWPSVVLEPWIYMLDGEAVAAVLVMVQPMPLKLGHLAVVKWGPILAHENGPEGRAVLDAASRHLTEEYAQRRGMMLSVIARAEPQPSTFAYESLVTRGFKPGTALPYPDRYFVKVRISDDEQRKSFAQKWRYHLNKSEKQGLAFEVALASEFERFRKLYECMTKRKKFPDYSAYQTLPKLLSDYPEQLKPQLFFVTKDGEDVAGAVIFTAGRTAVYLYGATNEAALPLRAGYLMHARIISWLRDHSVADWYDLGGNDGFQGLHQFKKGMVGQAGSITPIPPIAHYAAQGRAWLTGRIAHQARDTLTSVKVFASRMSGRLSKPDMRPGEKAP